MPFLIKVEAPKLDLLLGLGEATELYLLLGLDGVLSYICCLAQFARATYTGLFLT